MDRIDRLTDKQLLAYALQEIEKLNLLFKQNNMEQYNLAKFRVNQLIAEIKKRKLTLEKDVFIKRILFKE